MNLVVLMGRLVQDPELRFLPGNGIAVSTFTLAVDKGLSKEKKSEFEQSGKATADFIRVRVWGKQAENCANYLAKGRQVLIQGNIETGSYEKDGRRVYTTEVRAARVQFIDWGDKKGGSTNTSGTQGSPFDDDFGGIDGFEPIDNSDIPF